jgi:cytochrome b561
MRRRQRAGQWNRAVGWALIPMLLLATGAFQSAESAERLKPISDVLQVGLIVLTLLHAGLSLYVFGFVRPRRTLRVFHVYLGYVTFILVIVSQSTIVGPRDFHVVTTVLMYLAIVAHTIIGVRYQVIRRRARLENPQLVSPYSR